MKNIVIVGSGGFAKEVAFLIDEINKVKSEWNMLGFIDEKVGQDNGRYKIFNNDLWLENSTEELYVVYGVGFPDLIKRLSKKLSHKKNIKYPNLVHPSVIADWERIFLGNGNIICAGNIFTCDIKFGSFNVINLACTIGHDVNIGNYNVLNPSANISGGVIIGDEILIGTNSQILQYLDITSNTIIGAGAVVTKSISESGVYVGCPARKIK